MGRIFKFWSLPGLFFVSLLFTSPALAQTNGPAPGVTFDFTGENIGTVGNVTYGYGINVTSPFVISALGVFDGGGALAESHIVSVWNGRGALVAAVTVPAGTISQYGDEFSYTSITPLTLTSGLYTVGVYYQDGGERLVQNVSDLASGPGFTIVNYKFAHPGYFDPSLVITSANGGANFQNMFGANFLISPVPEPATLALLVLGAVPLILRRRGV